jgi:small conductance mechanosensitive channel
VTERPPDGGGGRFRALLPPRRHSSFADRARWLWRTAFPGIRGALAVGLLVTGLLLPALAEAQEARSTVRLDGRSLFRVSTTDDLAATDRAARVEARLTSLLETESDLPPAVAAPSSEGWVVTVAGVPVATVTEADAQDNLTSREVLARQWAGAIDRELARAREERVGWGGRFVAETRGAVQTAFARVTESAVRTLPRVLGALLVVGFFVGVAGLVLRGLRGIFRRTIEDLTFENLVKQLAYYSIILLGIIVAAGALGVTPEGLVTGLGLTGLVLGFALKDILSNFVSGLLILMLRPFQIGDQIVVGDTEGAVERIELRATQIRTYDGRVALVPNAEVFTSRIINNTADPVRRGSVEMTLDYKADLAALIPRIREAVQRADGVLERPVTARLEDLGTSGAVLNVGFWTDSRRSDFKDTSSAVRLAVVEALRAAGAALPEPEHWRSAGEAPRGGTSSRRPVEPAAR